MAIDRRAQSDSSFSIDHDLLIELRVNTVEILRRLDNQDRSAAAIENRVTNLEQFRYWVIGAATLASLLVGFLRDYFLKR